MSVVILKALAVVYTYETDFHSCSRVLALIKKFRLGFHEVEVLPDIYQSPQPGKYAARTSLNQQGKRSVERVELGLLTGLKPQRTAELQVHCVLPHQLHPISRLSSHMNPAD